MSIPRSKPSGGAGYSQAKVMTKRKIKGNWQFGLGHTGTRAAQKHLHKESPDRRKKQIEKINKFYQKRPYVK